jgi:hypothetical protein
MKSMKMPSHSRSLYLGDALGGEYRWDESGVSGAPEIFDSSSGHRPRDLRGAPGRRGAFLRPRFQDRPRCGRTPSNSRWRPLGAAHRRADRCALSRCRCCQCQLLRQGGPYDGPRCRRRTSYGLKQTAAVCSIGLASARSPTPTGTERRLPALLHQPPIRPSCYPRRDESRYAALDAFLLDHRLCPGLDDPHVTARSVTRLSGPRPREVESLY